jgi:hypothetical protein
VRASHENSKDKYPLNTKEFVPSEMGEVYTTGTYKDAHSVTTAAGFSKLKDFLLRMTSCPAAFGVMPRENTVFRNSILSILTPL